MARLIEKQEIAQLERATRALERAEAKAEAARYDRDALVAHLLAYGVRANEVAELLGVSRQRVYEYVARANRQRDASTRL